MGAARNNKIVGVNSVVYLNVRECDKACWTVERYKIVLKKQEKKGKFFTIQIWQGF